MIVKHNIHETDPIYYEYVFECASKILFNPADTEYYYIRNCTDRQKLMIEEMGYFYMDNTELPTIILPFGCELTGPELEMNKLLGLYIPNSELIEKYPL